jgi:hypothetical protein
MAILFSPTSIACALLAILVRVLISANKRPKFSIINDYPKDFLRRRAYNEYSTKAIELLKAGADKYGNMPFAVLVPNSVKIILPPSLVG